MIKSLLAAGAVAAAVQLSAAPKAQLVPGELLARELDVGACMFRDRSFVLQNCPDALKGVPYLSGPFADAPSVRAVVAKDGVVTVVSPNAGNVSQAEILREQGFEIDTSVPEFQAWGSWSCDKASVWRKVAKKGEGIRFGKWAFICDFDAGNMRVERPTEKNKRLMKRLRKEFTFAETLEINTTSPDYAVFIPPEPAKRSARHAACTHDTYNDHLQVIYDEKRKCHYAFWTQATAEPMCDHHTAFRKSTDGGNTWSPLQMLAGTLNTNRAEAAKHQGGSWQQPMLAKTGRLYVLWSESHTHRMGGRYSDDAGETWSEPELVDFDPRTPREKAEKAGRAEWWCNWQRPLRLGPDGHFLVGSSRGRDGVEFWEFLNIDENPRVRDIRIAVHSNGDKALKVPPDENGKSVCEEASIVKLPDGRLFAVMRATGGAAVWSESRDQGRSWTQPEKLRTCDGGDLIRHSVSPCPVYDWKGCEAGSGVYFGLFHLEVTDHRGPLYLVPGKFDPKAHQPVAFTGKPRLFEPRSHWNSFYTSYTDIGGKGTLWYPDCAKFYLLGRDITPDFVEEMCKNTAEKLALVGSTDKNPMLYACGEEIRTEIALVDLAQDKAPVKGRKLVWTRTGDDGITEKGEAMSDEPLVLKTKIDKPGFVRITVNVLDADGKKVRDTEKNRDLCWDGGAGADVNRIEAWPIPADFDSFWDARLAELAKAPSAATLTELKARDDRVYFAKFLVPMPNGEMPAQGLVAWPKAAKPRSLPLDVEVTGYGFHATAMDEHRALEGRLMVSVTRQGEDPRREKAYYENIRTNVCKGFCFRNNGGRPEETDFYKMLMRDAMALRWAKSLPLWDGKTICSHGGSMGGYQAIGLAALDPQVSEVKATIPWCADFAGRAKYKRLGGWAPDWTKALDYMALAHLATRVKCPVKMTIGLGDYICPPSGEVLLFNNLKGPKTLTVKQDMGHGSAYAPDVSAYTFRERICP